MDTRIKGKILSEQDVNEAKDLLGCFGYFGNCPDDFDDLENVAYGQLTEFPLGRVYGMLNPELPGGYKAYPLFVPESSVAGGCASSRETVHFDKRIRDVNKILAVTDFERIQRVDGRTMYPEPVNPAKEFLGTFGYFANSLNDFENLDNTLYAPFMEFSDRPKKQFFCAWIAIPGDTENAEKKKFLYFLPEIFVSGYRGENSGQKN